MFSRDHGVTMGQALLNSLAFHGHRRFGDRRSMEALRSYTRRGDTPIRPEHGRSMAGALRSSLLSLRWGRRTVQYRGDE